MQRNRDSCSLEFKQYYYPLAGKVFLVDLPVGSEEWRHMQQQIHMLGGTVEDSIHAPSVSHLVGEPMAVPTSPLVQWAELNSKTIYPLPRFRLFLKSRCADLQASVHNDPLTKINPQNRVPGDQALKSSRAFVSPRRAEIFPPMLCTLRSSGDVVGSGQGFVAPSHPRIILRDIITDNCTLKGSSSKGPYVKEFVPDEKNQSTVPCLRVESPGGYTPFLPLLDCQRIARFLSRVDSSTSSTSGSSVLGEKRKKPDYPNSLKTRSGYCENCGIHFQSYSKHVKTQKHKQYEENDDHFAELDSLMPEAL